MGELDVKNNAPSAPKYIARGAADPPATAFSNLRDMLD